ncbi:cholesterol 7-alpha-monooxygenase [Colletotrichum spaethianum]|uniref:Cholesterol 7-alpha-monooxygenase n=1 Tax=Colletotrichum spaethianum TaxID=700344 RepID=A0AA37LB26_9PEZI|nr:cholesterol 7-alpha-monooxygenase [Colletotrichum spaethianum]GKT43290.1 cholesterol 7-alpha-monooxygenase [Colletotrichum spaethianum]
MKGRPSSFFPYGGGYVMCPGRHFAKQEIMLAIAVLVTKFEIEFVEWTNSDGSKSDKPPQDDARFAGFIAMSPDRDAKIRWRRRW